VNPGRRARGTLVAALVCFGALSLAVVVLGTLPGEAPTRDWLLTLASPPVVMVFRAINYAGSWRVLLPGTVLLFVAFPQARRRWWVWVGLMLAAPAAESLLKLVIGRPRPEEASMGFPSGHATAAAAFFGAVVYLAGTLPPLTRRLATAGAIATIVLVALARVILRAHWPADTLAGIALGLGLAASAALLAGAQMSSQTSR